MVRVDRGFDRNVALSMRGFSFNFDTNYGKYVKWTKAMKKKARVAARNLCIEWAKTIVEEARKRCPEYSVDSPTNLANSIKEMGTEGRYSASNYGRSRISVDIGVDTDNWKSDYDSIVEDMLSRFPNRSAQLLTSGGELAVLLHESWEQLAGPKARERADNKSARTGERVGSHFLLRAYEENISSLKMQAVSLLEDAMSVRLLVGRGYTL